MQEPSQQNCVPRSSILFSILTLLAYCTSFDVVFAESLFASPKQQTRPLTEFVSFLHTRPFSLQNQVHSIRHFTSNLPHFVTPQEAFFVPELLGTVTSLRADSLDTLSSRNTFRTTTSLGTVFADVLADIKSSISSSFAFLNIITTEALANSLVSSEVAASSLPSVDLYTDSRPLTRVALFVQNRSFSWDKEAALMRHVSSQLDTIVSPKSPFFSNLITSTVTFARNADISAAVAGTFTSLVLPVNEYRSQMFGGTYASALDVMTTTTKTTTSTTTKKSGVPLLDKLSLTLYCSLKTFSFKDALNRSRCDYDTVAGASDTNKVVEVTTTTNTKNIPDTATTTQVVVQSGPQNVSVTKVVYVNTYTAGKDGKNGVDGKNGTDANSASTPDVTGALDRVTVGAYVAPTYIPYAPYVPNLVGISTIGYLKDTTIDTPTVTSGTFNGNNVFNNSALFTGTLTANYLSATSSSFLNASTTNSYIASLSATNSIFANSTTTTSYVTDLTVATSTTLFASTTQAFVGTLLANDATIGNSTTTNAYISSLYNDNAVTTNASTTNATTTSSYTRNALTDSATTTTSFISSLFATDSIFGNASSTSLFSSNSTFTNATTTNGFFVNMAATLATILNLNTTNGTTTNAYIASLRNDNAVTTNATTTNSYATNGVVDSFLATLATITGLTTTNATTTNFVATNSTSTTLSSTNLSTLNALLANGTSTNFTITNGSTTNATSTNLFASNIATTNATSTTLTNSGNTYLSSLTTGSVPFLGASGLLSQNNSRFFWDNFTYRLGLGTSTPTDTLTVDGTSLTTGTTTILGPTFQQGDVTIGDSTGDMLRVTALLGSNLVPGVNKAYDLGSPSFYYRNLYSDNINVNSISAASTTISGTASNDFAINTDNVTSDLEDMSLIFSRGVVPPNAVLRWASTNKRFEFNQSLRVQNETPTTGATNFAVQAGQGQGTTSLLTLLNNGGSILSAFTSDGSLALGTTSAPLFKLQVRGDIGPDQNATSSLGSATNRFLNFFGVNIYATSSVITNSTSTNGFVTNLSSTNATTTNLVATNASTTNSTTTNATVSNLSATNSTLQNATATNFVSTNASTTNFQATNSTSTNGFFANLAATISNIFNLNVTNSTTTNAYIASLRGDNATLTNATATNFFTTNLSNTNSSSVNASTTNLTVSNNAYFGGNTGIWNGSGNVGVGTTTPGAKLDIKDSSAANLSSIRVSNATNQPVFSVDNNGRLYLGTGAADTYAGRDYIFYASSTKQAAFVSGNFSINTSQFFVQQSNGNVGIGTTTPGAALSIETTGSGIDINRNNGAPSIRLSQSGNIIGQLRADSSLGVIGLSNAAGAFTLVANPTNGNVGIGTTSPSGQFEVTNSGTVILSAGGGNPTNGVYGRYLTTENFYSVYSSVANAKSAGSTGRNVYIDSTRMNTSGTLGFAPTGGDVYNTSDTVLSRSAANTLRLSSDGTTGTANLIVNGNVGIGTTTPGSKFVIENNGSNVSSDGSNVTGIGASSVRYELAANGANSYGLLNGLSVDGGALKLGIAGGNSYISGGQQGTGLFNVFVGATSSPKFTITSAGNVGIGTSTPGSTLTVAGTSNITGAATFGSTINATGNITTGNLLQVVDSNHYLTVAGNNFDVNNTAASGVTRLYGTAGIVFRTLLLDPAMTISQIGNVGIGTSTPSQKLTVGGNIAPSADVSYDLGTSTSRWNFGYINTLVGALASTTNATFTNASTTNFYAANFTNTNSTSVNASTTNLTVSNNAYFGGNTGIWNGSGNIGIGTTTPSYTLDVQTNTGVRISDNGNGPTGAALRLRNSFGTGDWLMQAGVTGVSDDYLAFRRAGASTYPLVMTNTGNVGIGTTTPQEKLSVYSSTATAGSFRGASAAGINIGSIAANMGYIQGVTGSDTATNIAFNPYGGNVGIGTTAPYDKLDVATNNAGGVSRAVINNSAASTNGNSAELGFKVNANFTAGYYSAAIAALQEPNTNTTSLQFRLYDVSGTPLGAEKMRITSAGNVGIGTTTPSQKLQVAGNIALNDSSYISGGGSQAGYTSFLNSINGAQGIQVGGLVVSNSYSGVIAPTNGAYIQGNVGIGTTVPGYKLEVAGIVASKQANPEVQIVSTTGGAGSFSIGTGWNTPGANKLYIYDNTNSATRMVIDNGGNVGIGTTTVGSKLTVAVSDSDPGVSVANAIAVIGSSKTVAMGTNATYGWLQSYSAPLYINNAGNNTILNGAGSGNVGIGTTVPNQKLVVGTDVGAITGANAILVGDATAPQIILAKASNNYSSISHNTNGLQFVINESGTIANPAMVVRGSGNVGIGTTNPLQKLVVTGGANGFEFVPGGTGAISIAQVYDRVAASYGGLNVDVSTFNVRNNGSGSAFYINNTGNVGIGTTVPAAKLDVTVNRANTVTGAQVYTYLGKTNESSNYAALQLFQAGAATAADRYWAFQTIEQGVANAGNIVFQQSGGNVGIGTTSPAFKLSVNSSASTYAAMFSGSGGKTVGIGGDGTAAYIQGLSNDIGSFTAPLALNAGGGNVGIGTTTPAQKLDIYRGSLAFHTNDSGIYYNSDTTGSAITGNSNLYFLTGGSVRTTIDSTGNVGIGTTSPTTMLSLGNVSTDAKIYIVNNNAGNRLMWSRSDGTQLTGIGSDGFGDITFLTNTTEKMRLTTGGNFGIGTTTPLSKLHIEGSTPGVTILDSSTSSSNGVFTLQNSLGNLGFFQGVLGVSAVERIRVSSVSNVSNNLGIQTTSGGVFTGTNLTYFPTSGNSFINNGGNVGIGTITPTNGKLEVQAGAAVAGYFQSSADTQIVLKGTDSWSGATFGDVSGTDYIWYNGANSTFSIGGGGSNVVGKKLHINGGTSIGTSYSASAVPINGLAVEGNVGIGTTAPRAPLEFGGGIGAITPLATAPAAGGNESLIISNSSNRTVGTAIGITYNGGASYDTYIQARGLYASGPAMNLLLNPLGGTVGIGTNLPNTNFKLDVQTGAGPYNTRWYNSSTSTSEYNVNIITGAMTSATGYFGIGGSATTNTYFRDSFVIGTQSAHSLNLNTSDTARLTILSGGNVGIGTTNPATKLNVSGGNIQVGDTTSTNTVLTGNQLYAQNNGSPSPLYLNFSVSGNTLINSNGGSVAIGSVAPRSKLDVTVGNASIPGDTSDVANFTGANQGVNNGNISVNTNNAFAQDYGGSIALGGLYRAGFSDNATYATIKGAKSNGSDSNYAGYLAFGTRVNGGSVTEKMRIDTAGNVGINNTLPEAKLDIGGNTAGAIQAIFARGVVDGNFRLIAQNGTSTSSAGSEMARFGLNYNGVGWNSGFRFLRGNSAVDGAIAIDTNQTERIRIDAAGNVGIGTTTTNAKLYVQGGAYGSTGTANQSAYALGADSIGVGSIYAYGSMCTGNNAGNCSSSGGVVIGPNNTSAAINIPNSGVTFFNNGNVGIGTTTPTASLDVYGGPTMTAAWNRTQVLEAAYPVLAFNSAAGGASRWGGIGYDAGYGARFWVASPSSDVPGGGANIMNLLNTGVANFTGNVGIGVGAPITPLHVVGNLSVTSLGGSASSSVGTVQLTTSGSSPINNRLTYGTDGSGWKFAIGKNQGGTVTDQLTLQDNGNVGIGTTSPQGTLHIAGSSNTVVRVEGGAASVPQMQFAQGSNVRGYLFYDNAGSAMTLNRSGSSAAGITVNSSDNVGIGTAAPNTKLEVNGGVVNIANSGADGALNEVVRTQLSGFTGTSNWRNSLYSSVSTTAANSILKFSLANSQTTQADVMTLLGNGNVGVGTVVPTSRLSIAGGALATTGATNDLSFAAGLGTGRTGTFDANTLSAIHTYFDNTSVEMSAGSTAGQVSGISVTGLGATNFSGTVRLSTSGAERMRITGTGNVGIGTTAPNARLHVYDSANIYSGVFAGNGGTNNVALGTAVGNVPAIQGYTNNFGATTNLALNPTGGNVGIGTTTPSNKLEVVGTLGLSGAITSTALATSTFSSSINLTGPNACFAINGVCLKLGGSVLSNSNSALTNGSYLDVTHNFGTTTLLVDAWAYNQAAGNYQQATQQNPSIATNNQGTIAYSTEANYSQEDVSYAVTLTPSATAGASITLTLGSGTWSADARVRSGCRVVGNGGEANISATPAAQTTITASTTIAFSNTSAIASGSWQMYCSRVTGGLAQLNLGLTPTLKAFPKTAYSYTGANQTYVVPQGVTTLTVKAWGAGGAGGNNSYGGGGGYVASTTLPVVAGESLTIMVGQGGVGGNSSSTSYGGGGSGQYNNGLWSGGGGGRSAIRRGSADIITAGAGGGASRSASLGAVTGGDGGGTTGTPGVNDSLGGSSAGGGGTQSAGGSAGSSSGGIATAGSQYTGGNGAIGSSQDPGGGGGGGYYGGGGGGGGGGYYGSGGGGGSSFGGTTTAGSGGNPGNSGDVDYFNGVGGGGSPYVFPSTGGNGRVVVSYSSYNGYATNTPYTLISSADSPSTSGWSDITGVVISESLNSQTIYYTVSFDSGITFRKYDTTASSTGWRPVAQNNAGTWQYNSNTSTGFASVTWTNATKNSKEAAISQSTGITANQMSGTQIQAVSDAGWNATGGFVFGGTASIIFGTTLKSTSDVLTPTVDSIVVNWISTGYQVLQLNASTTRLYNYTGTTQDVSLSVAGNVGGAGTGLTGIGQAGQVSYWNGSSGLSGSNSFFWDSLNSRLGIGTTTPGSRFDIYNNSASSNVDLFRLISDVGGVANVKFRIDSDGDLFTDGGTTIGSPADIAENYPASEAVDAGMVVAFASSTQEWSVDNTSTSTNNTFSMATVRKAYDGYEAVGIVSTRPGVLLSGNTENGVPVALSGRVPVKVTSENGEVKVGDYLTVSRTIPGYAMKLTGEGKSIARVVSDYVEGRDTVLAFIENGYQKVDMNGRYASTTSMLTVGNVDLNANGVGLYNIKSLASANGTWSIDENGRIVAKILCLEDVCIDKTQLQNILGAAGGSSVGENNNGGSGNGQVLGTSTTSGTEGSGSTGTSTATTTDNGSGNGSGSASSTPSGITADGESGTGEDTGTPDPIVGTTGEGGGAL